MDNSGGSRTNAVADGAGQMPAAARLAAGATGCSGTVEEPCNHGQKSARTSLLAQR
jgi:hypothetical protein